LLAGRAAELREMLNEIISWDADEMQIAFSGDGAAGFVNDQTAFGRYAALHPELVALDTDASLVWNLAGEYPAFEAMLETPGFQFVNPVTGAAPCFLHFTQVRKYYPTMLTAAHVLGVPLDARSADIELVAQHLDKAVPNIDSHVAKFDPRVERILTARPAYRLLRAKERAARLWKKFRMEAGRRRRMLLGQRTLL
jgi:hypothetical protein